MPTTEQLNTALAGRYAVDRLIGEGGMATVYLARDVRHNRKVALKVLKPDLGAVVGIERFLSEIQVTANLQHPNLLPLFDSGAADGLLFYVMPYIEGESLRAKLDREKQLPIDDAVRIAVAVASALDYAHRHGVIHRDLKPENILMHEGQPLVADFGIALAVSNAGGNRITQTGLSLGTPQYMSPEQATGDRTIDGRTDIYSLGAVTYEMLAGEAPHTGSTSQAIIARVLTEKPRSIRSSRPNVPAQVEGAVEHALEKLPADRWATAKEFSEALTGTRPVATRATQAAISTGAHGVASRAKRIGALAIAGWIVALAGIGATVKLATRRPTPPVPGRFLIEMPDSVSVFAGGGSKVTLSRDGSQLVIVGIDKRGRTGLYLRRSDDAQAQLIRGSDSASYPSFSPDGRWVLFHSGPRLAKVRTAGGVPQTLADLATSSSWGDGGLIVYVKANTLWRVSAEGGEPRLLATPDTARHYRRYAWPEMLPGGKAALITLWRGSTTLDSARLGVIAVDNGTVTDLGVRGSNPRYVAPGYIVFAQPGGSVLAAPFSLSKLKVMGTPSAVVDNVWQGTGGATDFAVSDNGSIVYHGGEGNASTRAMFVVDKQGTARQLPFEPQELNEPRVAPDGRHVVVAVGVGRTQDASRGISDLWIYDLAAGTRARLTSDSVSYRPEWSRDGTRVLYANRFHVDSEAVVSRSWNQNGEPQVLARGAWLDFHELSIGLAHGWSAFRSGSTSPGVRTADIVIAPTDSLSAVRPFVTGPAQGLLPRISPNGRLIAYMSDESGRYEVYLRQIPGPGPRVPVSVTGGTEPMWSPDGNTLYYRGPTRMMAATVIERPALAVGRVDSLFIDSYRRYSDHAAYDVFPNGKEFLMVQRPEQREAKIYVIVNWLQLTGKQTGASDDR